MVYLPPEKTKTDTTEFVCLSFGVDRLNWKSLIEIGRMACSTTNWCFSGKKKIKSPLPLIMMESNFE